MGVTSYYSIGGEIIGEEASGVRVDYLADALGSVTATVDQTGTVQNTYRYKPYGALLAKTGSAPDPAFTWVGTYGYRQTNVKFSDTYIRARHLTSELGSWTTVDNEWPLEAAFVYVAGNPTNYFDFDGESPTKNKHPKHPKHPQHPKPPKHTGPDPSPTNPPTSPCALPCQWFWITCFDDPSTPDHPDPYQLSTYCSPNAPVPKIPHNRCSKCSKTFTEFCHCQGEELGKSAGKPGTTFCINGVTLKIDDCGCGQKRPNKPSPDNWLDKWQKHCPKSFKNYWACVCPGPCKKKAE